MNLKNLGFNKISEASPIKIEPVKKIDPLKKLPHSTNDTIKADSLAFAKERTRADSLNQEAFKSDSTNIGGFWAKLRKSFGI